MTSAKPLFDLISSVAAATILLLALLASGPVAAEEDEEPGGAPKSDGESEEDEPEAEPKAPGKDAPKSDSSNQETEPSVPTIEAPELVPPVEIPPALEEGGYEVIEASGQTGESAESPPSPETPAEPPPSPAIPPAIPGAPPAEAEPAAEPRDVEEAEAPPEEETAEQQPFIKGELLDVSELDLLGTRSRAGVKLGYRAIGRIHFATVEPGADLRISKLRLGVSAPLNIEIWDGSEGLVGLDVSTGSAPKTEIHGFDNAGQIRGEDWDHWRDYFRILRYASWGRKEDNFHINVTQAGAGSIGHGTIMKRYLPQVDLDNVRIGAQFDAYANRLGGFEFYTNDITNWNMIGVLGFIKPLAPFFEDTVSQSLSIGVTFATDFYAPKTLAIDTITSGIKNTRTGEFFTWDVIRLDGACDETLPEAAKTARMHIWGIDTELKVVKTETTDIKLYVDYSSMIDAGHGFTGGALFRLNFAGEESVHALRIRAEARYFSGDYLPSYFDSFYEIDKWQYLTGTNAYTGNGIPPKTKYDAIASAAPDGHFGYFLEFGYSL
ncbi:MAG: hypothetical protein ABI333_08705, partial [bacterium]